MSLPAPSFDLPVIHVRQDDGVPVVVLPPDVAFDALREAIREAMPSLLAEIGGRSARLDVGTRAIELFDLRRVLNLLKEEFGVALTGLYARPEAITRFAERELKLKLFPISDEAPELEPEPAPEAADPVEEDAEAEAEAEAEPEPEAMEPESAERVRSTEPAAETAEPEADARTRGRRTLTVERTLRSGSSIRYDGDVLVLGDVNPGAEINATGNVMVLGALKGLAHAGAEGDTDAFILAFDLRPTQVRIARRIAIPASRTQELRAEPEVARIVGEHVVIEPYRPRNR